MSMIFGKVKLNNRINLTYDILLSFLVKIGKDQKNYYYNNSLTFADSYSTLQNSFTSTKIPNSGFFYNNIDFQSLQYDGVVPVSVMYFNQPNNGPIYISVAYEVIGGVKIIIWKSVINTFTITDSEFTFDLNVLNLNGNINFPTIEGDLGFYELIYNSKIL